jgi:hypothetical protein
MWCLAILSPTPLLPVSMLHLNAVQVQRQLQEELLALLQ